ncbi:ABC transporter permease [Methylocella sp.]|uniref:ABC transporter permease n=1 Tax=Methylocella sp. TaxID=1978226 RepID=UPI0037836D36
MNLDAIRAIFRFETARAMRTAVQSIASPALSSALYFIVFGGALGPHMAEIGGVPYGAFIVPGLIMSSVLTLSVANASFGIYFPRFSGTIYEVLSAPASAFEIVCGYVGAAAAKSVLVGLVILVTARCFVSFGIQHPVWMIAFLALTAIAFSLFGFVIGVLANSFEQIQLAPMLVITPLTFLGGVFYSIDMLPPFWRSVSLANPIVYLVSGFRWSFFGTADVNVGASLAMTGAFLAVCLAVVTWIFRTGYRLRA